MNEGRGSHQPAWVRRMADWHKPAQAWSSQKNFRRPACAVCVFQP